VQECSDKEEHVEIEDENDVMGNISYHVPTPKSSSHTEPEVLDPIRNDSVQRRSAQLVRNTIGKQVHLSYHGNKHLLRPKGSIKYNMGNKYVEGQAHFSVNSLHQAYVKCVMRVNETEGDMIDISSPLYKGVPAILSHIPK